MPLPLTVSYFSKVQIGFIFLVLASGSVAEWFACWTQAIVLRVFIFEILLHFWH